MGKGLLYLFQTQHNKAPSMQVATQHHIILMAAILSAILFSGRHLVSH